jgi:hypothetical protein
MSLKDDEKEINNIKKEVHELQEQSLALELLKDYKKQNKRQFIVILVILGMWFSTIGYLVYILNDIGTETTTTKSYDMSTENGNNNFVGGNNNGNIENN